MGINVRAYMIFPELRPPANAEVTLRQGEEGGLIIISTVPAELEETPTLWPSYQHCTPLALYAFNTHSVLTMK
jgi:hypothetical protein